jgi:hypothetical protein
MPELSVASKETVRPAEIYPSAIRGPLTDAIVGEVGSESVTVAEYSVAQTLCMFTPTAQVDPLKMGSQRKPNWRPLVAMPSIDVSAPAPAFGDPVKQSRSASAMSHASKTCPSAVRPKTRQPLSVSLPKYLE